MAARIVALDIERAAGVAEGIWQLKQNGWLSPNQIIEPPKTICFAWKWLGEDEIHFSAEWQRGHKAMVRKAHAVLDEADYVVGWNSKNFDCRHLRSEFILHGLYPPAPHKDIDLMLTAKRNFGFLSNRMSYIAGELDCGSKLDTGGGDLWRKLRHAKGEELQQARSLMQAYNEQDVVLTEELFMLMRPWCAGLNLPLYSDTAGDDLGPFCPNCASPNIQFRGVARNTSYAYRRFQCTDCGKWGRTTESVAKTAQVPL
jgi:hypothetical protein